ncbi:tRNA pseudouridine(55) synthase TruB [Candidatus Saccharibacteria bacterium]|nr:tRNA pseudouridine(55) synthase TruB [Candidatus Saccharibacteria bacterium]
MNTEDDILPVDKPVGWTSFDVVAKIRGKIRAEYTAKGKKPTKKQLRVGHAGTLDPFATGLLIILLGEGCKKADEFLKLDKTYEFTAKLGEISTTGDPEGELTQTEDRKPEIEEVKTALGQFKGEITQIPPAFSAIKVDGKRAYKLAREGKEVVIPPRQVTIFRLELIDYNYPYLKCVCDVSSGTYIRTLVEDIGKALNTGAYCQQLRRTRIAKYSIEDAISIDKI